MGLVTNQDWAVEDPFQIVGLLSFSKCIVLKLGSHYVVVFLSRTIFYSMYNCWIAMSTIQGYNMHLTSSTFSNIDLSIMRIYYFLKKEKRKKKNLLFIFSSITIIMSIYAHSVNSFFFFFFRIPPIWGICIQLANLWIQNAEHLEEHPPSKCVMEKTFSPP